VISWATPSTISISPENILRSEVTARSSVEVQPSRRPTPPTPAPGPTSTAPSPPPLQARHKRRLLGDASPQPVRQVQPAPRRSSPAISAASAATLRSSFSPNSTSPSTSPSPTSPTAPRRLAHRRRPPLPPGSLSGFRSHHDRSRPSPAHSLLLCQRIHVSPRRSRRKKGSLARRCVPRLD
jgi:hypothetical protein